MYLSPWLGKMSAAVRVGCRRVPDQLLNITVGGITATRNDVGALRSEANHVRFEVRYVAKYATPNRRYCQKSGQRFCALQLRRSRYMGIPPLGRRDTRGNSSIRCPGSWRMAQLCPNVASTSRASHPREAPHRCRGAARRRRGNRRTGAGFRGTPASSGRGGTPAGRRTIAGPFG